MLLENILQAPEIVIQVGDTIVIRVLAQACRGALALSAEYLFQRLNFCSQHRVRWVAHDNNGAFIKANDYRGPRFKSKPVIERKPPKYMGLI